MFKDNENGVGYKYIEKQKDDAIQTILKLWCILKETWDTKYVNKMLGTPASNEELKEENRKG